MVSAFSTTPIVTPLQQELRLLATICAGIAAAWLAWIVRGIVARDLPLQLQSWEFDAVRQARLRAGNRMYRWFEPLIQELAGAAWFRRAMPVKKIGRLLDIGAENLPWKAEEYIATVAMKAAMVALAAALLGGLGLVLSILIAGVLFWRDAAGVERRARSKVAQFKLRLPFAVDLIALTMEAGANFRDSLATVVRDNREHPLGVEFNTLLQGLHHGKTLRQCLLQLKERFRDEELDEMVVAVSRGDELGTPLSQIFLVMADQMRLKRSQWAEKAAGKAQAMITFPGLVIFVACLLVLLAPFAMNTIQQYCG
jgi:tight adherence protein C